MLERLSSVFSRPWIYCALIIVKAAFAWSLVFGGTLPGNDDYMRFAQVSDLLQGQDWFDTDQSRYASPEGGDIHWSRLPDLGVVALYYPARVFAGHEQSLYFAALMWPTMLFCGLIAVFVSFLRKLEAGPVAIAFGVLIVVSSYAGAQFQPGRIDHHGLVMLFGFLSLRLILERSIWTAFLAALLSAAMVSIAIEALPFVFSILVVFGLLWVLDPETQHDRFVRFGAGLAFGATVFYFLDAPGLNAVERAVCDAYGAGHARALILGGLGLASLGALKRVAPWSLDHPVKRLGAGVVIGAIGAGGLAIAAPYCLSSPYDLPEVVTEQWLSRVAEAMSLPRDLEANGARSVARYLVPILSLLAGLWWATRVSDAKRRVLIVILIPMLVSILSGVWQVRGLTPALVFAAIPAAVIFSDGFTAWRRKGGSQPLLKAFLAAALLAPFLPQAVAGRISPRNVPAPLNSQGTLASCATAEALQPLANLPAGIVFAEVDLGAKLLHFTPHSMVVAPYHRNAGGIAAYYEAFGAETDRAFLSVLERSNVDYLVVCDNGRTQGLENSPLKVRLATGGSVEGLTPIQIEDTPIRIFRVE